MTPEANDEGASADEPTLDGAGGVDAGDREAWVKAARPFLIQIARRYGALTTADDVAEEAQALSGIRTKRPPAEWIGDVLDDVGLECGARNEPLLTAFCIGPDGRVGDRYRELVVHLNGTAPVDIEMHAATQRVEAHEYHGATMPVDPRPVLPPELVKQRTAAAKRPGAKPPSTRAPATKKPSTPRVRKPPAPKKPKKPELPARAVCPTCFLQMPVSGRCDNCDPD
jgi:hypothetical protein